jgi:hypothetical protein
MLVFFAISGAWQALQLHRTMKNSSYRAPVVLQRLSDVHMNQRFSSPARIVYRVTVLTMSSAFVVAAGIGILLAFRLTRPR